MRGFNNFNRLFAGGELGGIGSGQFQNCGGRGRVSVPFYGGWISNSSSTAVSCWSRNHVDSTFQTAAVRRHGFAISRRDLPELCQ
jgi:hypothetical protein